MIPKTRDQFRQVCLENLGQPVIKIEVASSQIENAIDQALHYYWDYHWDGTEKQYLKHAITDTDITNQYISIPDEIIEVINVLPFDSFGTGSTLFDVRYQIALNEMFNLTATSLVPYYLAQQHISLINEMFTSWPQIRFNRKTDKLYLDTNWSDLKVGSYILVECYKALDPEIYPDVWKDRWLIEYATALIQKQWSRHLTKLNLTLPGNVTFNARDLANEADQKIKELRDELAASSPVMMPFIG